ncbi:MAG: hypothetical protein KAR84_07680 [Elusimicrobiales bacterium]|nr:hypothetical protein [Elusimicrobiales bacterium]MCK5106579.1 hypothetical protein [Elusimicrobiales bacterium]MCK5357302.1 hypothetical protein [Elusimicrobiales bacterium]MCK5582441.1 hypothetical protein [Elusimicrobiales bacterium]
MDWKEINTKYEKSKKGNVILKRLPKRGKDWNNIMKSTDKLVWLFMMSGNKNNSAC